jgi:lysophospholipid acyltransferase (LPLAT)-like uncharacterized protein
MRRLLRGLLGLLAACVLVCWRATLRIRVEDDPRPGLRAAGRRYVYAILHAQQLSFILLSDDVPILAMVSASTDGDWLVPLCRVRRIIPIRGSSSFAFLRSRTSSAIWSMSHSGGASSEGPSPWTNCLTDSLPNKNAMSFARGCPGSSHGRSR